MQLVLRWLYGLALATVPASASAAAEHYPSRNVEIIVSYGAGVPEFDLASWTVMPAPKGTPAEIVMLLRTEVLKALADPKVRKALAAQGVEPSENQDVKAFLTHERDAFGRAVRELGITVGQ